MSAGLHESHHNHITIYTFLDSSDDSVETWAAALCKLIDTTPLSQPFYVLMDVSAPHVQFTRLARQKSSEIFTTYRARQGYMAFLFSSKIAPHFSRLFFASLGRLNFDLHFYSDRETALTWLHESHDLHDVDEA